MSTRTEPLDLDLRIVPAAAAKPPEFRGLKRDNVRLLVIERQTKHIHSSRFRDIADYLNPGDLVVVNTSATIAGQLLASIGHERCKIHLATRLTPVEYIVERRRDDGGPDERAFSPGQRIEILNRHQETMTTVEVVSRFHANSRFWRVRSAVDLFALATDIGVPIHYDYLAQDYDQRWYRGLFSRDSGSAEMPSASRPFTPAVLKKLVVKGVKVRSLVLHTGVSSHEVRETLSEHPVLPEWYSIPPATSREVNNAKRAGRRIIAVGTTVVRALESAVNTEGQVVSGANWTTHLVTPDTPPRTVDGLITGMHDSHTSHLALLYTFVPPSLLRAAYRVATENHYLWHEFGDVSLLI